MGTSEFKLDYPYSYFWLIFWVIVFFPVALVLLLTGAAFTSEGKRYAIKYGGSRGWLAFWTLVCFPVTFILLLLNGFSISVAAP